MKIKQILIDQLCFTINILQQLLTYRILCLLTTFISNINKVFQIISTSMHLHLELISSPTNTLVPAILPFPEAVLGFFRQHRFQHTRRVSDTIIDSVKLLPMQAQFELLNQTLCCKIQVWRTGVVMSTVIVVSVNFSQKGVIERGCVGRNKY